ncbi:MAG TPA: hypothetical protein DGG95_01290 [Cytophagales bacterium]|jgi:hypothetical protein|nr:hypothetical protein [Cytophagales bacterium]
MDTPLKFRRALFWDISEKDIDRALQESDDWVMVRVFEYGSLTDISQVIQLYGSEKCAAVLSSASLRPMAAAMAYLFLNVDPSRKYATA